MHEMSELVLIMSWFFNKNSQINFFSLFCYFVEFAFKLWIPHWNRAQEAHTDLRAWPQGGTLGSGMASPSTSDENNTTPLSSVLPHTCKSVGIRPSRSSPHRTTSRCSHTCVTVGRARGGGGRRAGSHGVVAASGAGGQRGVWPP